MRRTRKKAESKTTLRRRPEPPAVPLRIIGGHFRGRKLGYSGDPRTRPMKDRVREALFNLLGPSVRGRLAIDLFAGTGALGLEAISRGAGRAIFLEQHFPTAAVIRQNIASLDFADVCEVAAGDTFIWYRRRPELGSGPWLVFCSPPYDFYVERREAMLELIAWACDASPAASVVAVECDERFDLGQLPHAGSWSVHRYRPAVVAIYYKP